MSLFLQRVFPAPEEFQLSGSIGAELSPLGVDVMALGVTICMPGENEKSLNLKGAGSPFVARFRPAEGMLGGDSGEYRDLLRDLVEKLFEGLSIQVRTGFYWSLLRNGPLAAELNVERGPSNDAILLMERREDRDKPFPDAVYRLSRLSEHDFLRDLIDQADTPPEGRGDPGE
jgi:hypothetical protein